MNCFCLLTTVLVNLSQSHACLSVPFICISLFGLDVLTLRCLCVPCSPVRISLYRHTHAHTAWPSPLTSCFHCSMKDDLYHVQPLLSPRDELTNCVSSFVISISSLVLSPWSRLFHGGVLDREFY